MFDSPLSASAYEVLDVAPTVDGDALRRAFRVRLRQTHPDTGGDAAEFVQVQAAWELVGTPAARAAYDAGRDDAARLQWSGWRDAPRAGTRPRTSAHGTAGAWRRARYLELVRERAGDDPYDPAFVRTTPWEARRMLADALAEEDTARTIAVLGMGFTAWHDVATGPDPEQKLDHVVLGPSGLYGLMSDDLGGVVGFRRGDLFGPAVGDRTPIADLLARVRAVSRAARVRFRGAVLVLPDDDLPGPVNALGEVRGVPVAVISRSAVHGVLRSGIPGSPRVTGHEVFDVRARIQQSVRFV